MSIVAAEKHHYVLSPAWSFATGAASFLFSLVSQVFEGWQRHSAELMALASGLGMLWSLYQRHVDQRRTQEQAERDRADRLRREAEDRAERRQGDILRLSDDLRAEREKTTHLNERLLVMLDRLRDGQEERADLARKNEDLLATLASLRKRLDAATARPEPPSDRGPACPTSP